VDWSQERKYFPSRQQTKWRIGNESLISLMLFHWLQCTVLHHWSGTLQIRRTGFVWRRISDSGCMRLMFRLRIKGNGWTEFSDKNRGNTLTQVCQASKTNQQYPLAREKWQFVHVLFQVRYVGFISSSK
jgi:hypothetical protein